MEQAGHETLARPSGDRTSYGILLSHYANAPFIRFGIYRTTTRVREHENATES